MTGTLRAHRSTLHGNNDIFSTCRRRISASYNMCLNIAPVEVGDCQISIESDQLHTTRLTQCYKPLLWGQLSKYIVVYKYLKAKNLSFLKLRLRAAVSSDLTIFRTASKPMYLSEKRCGSCPERV